MFSCNLSFFVKLLIICNLLRYYKFYFVNWRKCSWWPTKLVPRFADFIAAVRMTLPKIVEEALKRARPWTSLCCANVPEQREILPLHVCFFELIPFRGRAWEGTRLASQSPLLSILLAQLLRQKPWQLLLCLHVSFTQLLALLYLRCSFCPPSVTLAIVFVGFLASCFPFE